MLRTLFLLDLLLNNVPHRHRLIPLVVLNQAFHLFRPGILKLVTIQDPQLLLIEVDEDRLCSFELEKLEIACLAEHLTGAIGAFIYKL